MSHIDKRWEEVKSFYEKQNPGIRFKGMISDDNINRLWFAMTKLHKEMHDFYTARPSLWDKLLEWRFQKTGRENPGDDV